MISFLLIASACILFLLRSDSLPIRRLIRLRSRLLSHDIDESVVSIANLASLKGGKIILAGSPSMDLQHGIVEKIGSRDIVTQVSILNPINFLHTTTSKIWTINPGWSRRPSHHKINNFREISATRVPWWGRCWTRDCSIDRSYQ